MIDNLNFKGDYHEDDEPYIFASSEKGTIEIAGRLLMETPNIEKLQTDITTWITQYFWDWVDPSEQLILHVKLSYIDTSASKALFLLFNFLEGYIKFRQKKSTVNWYYEAGDEDMQEMGQLYQEEFTGLDFNLISKPNLLEEIDEILLKKHQS